MNDMTSGDESNASPADVKAAAYARAMAATENAMKEGRLLQDADIATTNVLNRFRGSELMGKVMARGIWFDEDFNPPDPGSDRDPDDPWHQHHPVPIDVNSPW